MRSRPIHNRGHRQRRGGSWLVFLLVIVLISSSTGLFLFRDHIWGVRADARQSAEALRAGDQEKLADHLAHHRGDKAFAFYFASHVSPRELGDFLATFAGGSRDLPLRADIIASDYDVILTDLAGALALATHGNGDRALPDSWATEFSRATTAPEKLSTEGNHRTTSHRKHQDLANQSNLLLLLSRGHWSATFLQKITRDYYEIATKKGSSAWPALDTLDPHLVVPAPNGIYLTDGILALTAALAANPDASKWAFTDFLPGNVVVKGSGLKVGKFTHFLLFDYGFPGDSSEENPSYGVALTALSAAVDSESVELLSAERPTTPGATIAKRGPTHDARIIQTLALEFKEKQGSKCTFNPRDWFTCASIAGSAIWSFVLKWGHLVLEILSFTTVFPFPFGAIGISAATANAAWYAAEGNFERSGLSLASAVPGIAFVKLGKWAKTSSGFAKSGTSAALLESSAAHSARVAANAKLWRPLPAHRDCTLATSSGGVAVKYAKNWTREQRRSADAKVKTINQAAGRGEVSKTKPSRSNGSASQKYERGTGNKVPAGKDLDHTVDLQLGGKDEVSNMKPLDRAVNRSLGSQLASRMKDLPFGTQVPAVAICK